MKSRQKLGQPCLRSPRASAPRRPPSARTSTRGVGLPLCPPRLAPVVSQPFLSFSAKSAKPYVSPPPPPPPSSISHVPTCMAVGCPLCRACGGRGRTLRGSIYRVDLSLPTWPHPCLLPSSPAARRATPHRRLPVDAAVIAHGPPPPTAPAII
jgi:hypothetical protein